MSLYQVRNLLVVVVCHILMFLLFVELCVVILQRFDYMYFCNNYRHRMIRTWHILKTCVYCWSMFVVILISFGFFLYLMLCHWSLFISIRLLVSSLNGLTLVIFGALYNSLFSVSQGSVLKNCTLIYDGLLLQIVTWIRSCLIETFTTSSSHNSIIPNFNWTFCKKVVQIELHATHLFWNAFPTHIQLISYLKSWWFFYTKNTKWFKDLWVIFFQFFKIGRGIFVLNLYNWMTVCKRLVGRRPKWIASDRLPQKKNEFSDNSLLKSV